MGGIEKDCRGSVQCVLRMYTCSVGVYSVKVWFLYTHIHTLYTHPAHEHCGYTPLSLHNRRLVLVPGHARPTDRYGTNTLAKYTQKGLFRRLHTPACTHTSPSPCAHAPAHTQYTCMLRNIK